jgi:hypothetical protein
MISGMYGMTTRRVGMMGGLFVVAAVVMLGCFIVMMCSMLMMFRGFPVMFGCLLRHGCFPSYFFYSGSTRDSLSYNQLVRRTSITRESA